MADAKTPRAKTQDDAAEAAPPPFWIADCALPVGAEMGGEVAGVRAFNPGDRVPAEHVERYGWAQYVHPPDLTQAAPSGMSSSEELND